MNTESQIRYLKIESIALKRSVYCSIYIPADIDEIKSYPSLYLLHGVESNYKDWIEKGEVNKTADALISQNELKKLFIIMPDAGDSFYSNAYDDSEKYEDFFMKELIPKIESEFNIIRNRNYRGIGGLSMGGFGALKLALKYPEVFSIAFSHSGALFDEPDALKTTIESVAASFKRIFGSPYDKKHWELNNPYSLLKSKENNKKIAFYLDCGKSDRIFHLSENMHKFLTSLNIDHIYNVFEGEHTWDYWKTHIKDSLLFLNNISVQQKG